MTPAVTAGLLHDLVTHSHAEGITALDVEAVIEHDDRVLLIAEPGPDFTDETWQRPGGPVLPGQTLTDALHPAVAAIGLTIDARPPGCTRFMRAAAPSPITPPPSASSWPARLSMRMSPACCWPRWHRPR